MTFLFGQIHFWQVQIHLKKFNVLGILEAITCSNGFLSFFYVLVAFSNLIFDDVSYTFLLYHFGIRVSGICLTHLYLLDTTSCYVLEREITTPLLDIEGVYIAVLLDIFSSMRSNKLFAFCTFA